MKKAFLFLIAGCLFFSFTPRSVKWIAIGDSITYLNDHLNETGNRVTMGYMTRVTHNLPNVSYINQGHNGWTSGGIANKIDSLGLAPADVYTIFLGTNDWWQGRPIGVLDDYINNRGNSTVYGSFRIITNKLRALNNDAKIILITPMQRSDFVYINNKKNNAWGSYKEKNGQSLSQFADAIDSIAHHENFRVVDLYYKSGINQKNLVRYKLLKDPSTGNYKTFSYPSFINVPFNAAEDEYPYPLNAVNMTYDGLHPSDKGNAVIAGMLLKYLKKL